MTRILVERADFRAALKSVLPHAYTGDKLPALNRIRLDVGPVNVTVTATDHFTAGLAIMSVHAHLDTGPTREETELPWIAALDIYPHEAKNLLSVFIAKRDKRGHPKHLLRIEADDNHVTVIDSDGMIDGTKLSVRRLEDGNLFPDIEELIANHYHADTVLVGPITQSGERHARFIHAEKAYGTEGLQIRTTSASRAELIGCGESFLGLLFPVPVTDEDAERMKEWNEAWDRRLPRHSGFDLKTATGIFSVSDLEGRDKS